MDENRHPIAFFYHNGSDVCPVHFDDVVLYELTDPFNPTQYKVNTGAAISWNRVTKFRVIEKHNERH